MRKAILVLCFLTGFSGAYAADESVDNTTLTDASSYNYGLTAGLQMPIAGVQLFGTYIAGGVLDPAAGGQNIDMKFTEARGYRVGAGIHILAVSLNLEYQDLTYNNSVIESYGNLSTNLTTKVDASQVGHALSLGFPVEF